jgi:RNA polymerase-binding transcription factor DksA
MSSKAKKPAAKKAAPKPAASKPAAKPAAKKPAATKPAATKPAPKKPAAKPAKSAAPVPPGKGRAVVKKKPAAAVEKPSVRRTRGKEATVKTAPVPKVPAAVLRQMPKENWTPPPDMPKAAFHKRQRQRLLELKDSLMDSVSSMANETLRARAEGSEASAFGMHQADAGSDAYDRDFALSLLSKEQDALFEIEEALKRLDKGTYGVCEMSGKPIPQPRLEALPFAKFTVDCQQEYEREIALNGGRRPVRSLFGLMGDEDEEEEGEEKETVDKSED